MDISTRLELVRALKSAGIRNSAYSVSGAVDMALCIERTDDATWEVFYFERGVKTFSKRFATEPEACSYMYKELLADKTSFL